MGYSTYRCGFLVTGICLLIAARASAEVEAFPEGDVGAYGAPDRLVFEGCQAVTPGEIKAALLRDWDVVLASAPSNRLSDYVAVIRRKVRTGYEASGFAKVEISCGADAQHGTVVVSIKEGPRYRRGAVHVTGVQADLSRQTIEKLTRPGPAQSFSIIEAAGGAGYRVKMVLGSELSSPAWKRGDPARFDPVAGTRMEQEVAGALRGLGYFDPKLDAKVEIEQDQAVLHVTVADEGRHATIDKVNVTGLKKNRPEDLLKFLGVEKGQEISLDRLNAIQRRLWDSARFKKHELTIAPSGGDRSRLSLEIELEEFPDAPTLTEPLSPVEQALINACQWLRARPDAGEDVEVVMHTAAHADSHVDMHVQFVVGPTGGVCRIRAYTPAPATAPAEKTDARPLVDYALAMTTDLDGIYSISDGKKLTAALGKALAPEVGLRYAPEVAPDGSVKWSINFDAGFRTEEIRPPLLLTLAPVAFVSVAHLEGMKYEIRDGILTINGEQTKVRVETGTGRVLECRVFSHDSLYAISVRRGMMGDFIGEMEKAIAAPNCFDPKQPAASSMAFIAEQTAKGLLLRSAAGPEQRARAAVVLGKLLSPDVFEPTQRLFSPSDGKGSDDFFIPPDGSTASVNDALGTIVKIALPYFDRLFPHDSWPGTLLRQRVLLYVNQRKTAESELDRVITSHRTGPVGLLMTARLVSEFSPTDGDKIAARGLKRLDVTEFRKDVSEFTEGDGVAAEILRRAADKLRQLPQQDIDDLADVLSPEQAKTFRQIAAVLRAHPHQPIEKLLPAALDNVWAQSLRESVESALHGLASRGSGTEQ
jgi:hypothetical protein